MSAFNAEQTRALQRGLARAWMLWGGLLGTMVLYLFLARLLGPTIAGPLPLAAPGGRAAFLLYAVAGLVFLCAAAVRKSLLAPAGGPAPLTAVLSRYLVAVVVSGALVDAVAVFAVVLHVLGLPLRSVFTLLLFCVLAMLLFRPRRAELEAFARSRGRPPDLQG